jgi:hypothetical protein
VGNEHWAELQEAIREELSWRVDGRTVTFGAQEIGDLADKVYGSFVFTPRPPWRLWPRRSPKSDA